MSITSHTCELLSSSSTTDTYTWIISHELSHTSYSLDINYWHIHVNYCTWTTDTSAPEASWKRVFDPCTPILFDFYRDLEQNGYFWLVPERAPGPSSQVLPGCRVRHVLFQEAFGAVQYMWITWHHHSLGMNYWHELLTQYEKYLVHSTTSTRSTASTPRWGTTSLNNW